jgi:hypothetical protein
MKKLLIFLAILLISLVGYTQNGGQAQENSVIRIEYRGFLSGKHVYRIINKQPCQVRSEYRIYGQPNAIEITLPASGFIEVELNSLEATTVKAKAQSFCPNTQPDRGWVEVVVSNTLPVKFKSLSIKKLSENLLEVTFEAYEDNTIKYYNIMVGTDGKNYRIATMVFPNGIEGDKKYVIKVKI